LKTNFEIQHFQHHVGTLYTAMNKTSALVFYPNSAFLVEDDTRGGKHQLKRWLGYFTF